MPQERPHAPEGGEVRPARLRVLMVDHQILTLWAEAARQRQSERLRAITRQQYPPTT